MAASSRESRRRKILERGSDRLAFVTGRAPPPSQLHHAPETDSSKPLVSNEPRLSDQTTDSSVGNDKIEGDPLGSTLLKQDSAVDAANSSAFNNERSAESLLPESKTRTEASSVPALVVNGREQSSFCLSTDQNSSVSASSREQQHMEPRRGQLKFLTPSQISSAISATERTRLFCSIAIALFVVFSYLEFPPLGSGFIKLILGFRPLFLVLLTNVTAVVSRLLFNNRGGFQRAVRGGDNSPSTDSWAQVSNTLEVGLMMQKVIDAIFMDCSVYSIVVICGLAFS
ncbi:hypothetical protein CICLE_v10009124mg [Citrus x clementina]|uniref:Uncharacterized protein n=1 Tax=Citrus clementina TaxID=85681 RepID=V4UHY7_CITCL|nr:uncharacterized protein LOC18054520 [Citrus x clementina]ESR63835.1 hypothetical protein CICLE_v10009124mg [Citrus x clementina]